MTKNLYTMSGVVDTIYDPVLNSIIVTWQNLGPHKYLRPSCEAQLKSAKQDGAKAVIIDTSSATGIPSQEDQQWFGSYLFPSFQRAGVKAIITVLPASAIGKLAAKQWQSTGQQFGIEFIDTNSMQTAKTLAKKYAL